MSGRNQLRQEAAQLRGQIDRRAHLVRRRIDSLLHKARALARRPAAPPLAFVGGFLAERLDLVPGVQRAYGLLVVLASRAKALQIASNLLGSPPAR